MMFDPPLIPGVLIRRYKRFLADVALETGETVTAHVANPGSMMGLTSPGMAVWLSKSDDPKRKLAYSWELCRPSSHGWVGVHTGHPNRLVAEAVAAGEIAELAGYPSILREVKYGRNSRIDLLLKAPGRPDCYVEVKSVTLKRDDERPGCAEFPDAVTVRGAKHLDEMAEMAAAGRRAVMVYLIQRDDCDRFRPAGDIDPRYAARFVAARAKGVEAICYACVLSPREIRLARSVPLAL